MFCDVSSFDTRIRDTNVREARMHTQVFFWCVSFQDTSSIINRLLVFAKYMRQVLHLYLTNKVID